MVGKRETNGRLNDASFWAVIPAGGSGTRLWPLSRSGKPKFLLPLLGDRSLIQQTVGRLGELAPIERTLVICGPAHAVAVGRQLPELPESRIVVEPAPKGSGPAIALAAAIIARHDPDAVMGSFAADHEVRDQAAFEAAPFCAEAVMLRRFDDVGKVKGMPIRNIVDYRDRIAAQVCRV